MKLKKCEQNPILKQIKNNEWESKAVFNPGVAFDGKKVHMLYRAIGEYKNYISRLGYAFSEDGINFERGSKPVFKPREEYEKFGCEDPRIIKIGNRFYITYVALSKPARKSHIARTALASTRDFKNFKRIGIITPSHSDNRDVVLFPEKINGKYVMLHRPHNWIKKEIYEKNGKLYLRVKEKVVEWPLEEVPEFPEKPSIWIAYSNNLKDWQGHKVLAEPRERWEEVKIGAGPPPIKTKEGWLLFYHGVGKISKPFPKLKRWDGEIQENVYSAGAILLDLKDPTKIIGRTKKPILKPEKNYEIYGDVPNVVFVEGAVIIGEELFVYYGAADKTCCLATCKLDKLLNFLLKK